MSAWPHFRETLLLFAFVVFLLAGCGPGRGDLQGKVSYQNKVVRSGSVLAVGGDGLPRGGKIEDDGTYTIRDICAGPVKILVNSPDPGNYVHHPRKKDEPPPPPKDRSHWFEIPGHYGDFETSG